MQENTNRIFYFLQGNDFIKFSMYVFPYYLILGKTHILSPQMEKYTKPAMILKYVKNVKVLFVSRSRLRLWS